MPEGPELRFMAAFVNRIACDRKAFVSMSRSVLATHPRKHPGQQDFHNMHIHMED
jgi:hypothetical protein